MLVLFIVGLLATPAHASSTCYLYDGNAYWNCLREERADDQKREELREQIHQDNEDDE